MLRHASYLDWAKADFSKKLIIKSRKTLKMCLSAVMREVVICYFLLLKCILYIKSLLSMLSISMLVLIHLFVSVLCRICGCGSGESGCSSCGCCKACARELDGQEARQRGIFDAVKEMIPLDLLLGTEVSSNHIQYSFISIKSHPFLSAGHVHVICSTILSSCMKYSA